MGLFDSLRSRLFWLSGPATVDVPVSDATVSATDGDMAPAEQAASSDTTVQTGASETDLSARQERAASRLLEDERLRGDLTDDEFQPLLDWAMAAAERLVDSTASNADDLAEQRIDTGLNVVRGRVAAAADAVTAYAEGDHDRLTAALRDAGVLLHDASADGTISRLLVQHDLSGPDVAAQIVSQLTTEIPDPSDRPTAGTS
jgi:hypothetical protein